MKIPGKKSVWCLVAIYLAMWFLVSIIAGAVLNSYQGIINNVLGLTGYRTETVATEGDELPDLEYFKSDYVQKDEAGNVLYTTDENGYRHQVYDDVSLWDADVEASYRVQREGTTILWNKESGLPLKSGNKVSLLSRSSANWVYSGTGSAKANTSGASNMQKALQNAGLSVNPILWNFYTKGAGSGFDAHVRDKVNEVPWSRYTSDITNSFSQYGDAAILVFSRQLGEGSVYSGGPLDAESELADTVSGDYFDLHRNEENLLSNIVNFRRDGTFKKLIVLFNTPASMNLEKIMQYKNDIDACLWVGQTGWGGLDEVGNILAGKTVPSGHLADTFVYNTRSAPAFTNAFFTGYANLDEVKINNYYANTFIAYVENIYVGYKYYETRYEDAVLGQGNATAKVGVYGSKDGWKYSEEVAFPFGWGGAYTTFSYGGLTVTKQADGNYEVQVTVTNTGDEIGADAVQIYIQRPYTEHDKEFGLEQAAVNLVGYAKTSYLEPNAKETVTITVRDDAFKTYDDADQNTYIYEAGTYYLTAATDAHAAVNNILAAKGKTPSNTGNVMDAEGDRTLVKTVVNDKDDYTTFAVSDTGAAIENQFENADWNKYMDASLGTIPYLSRSDWEATYPTQKLVLKVPDDMPEILSWNKTYEADPADVMPEYEQAHVFNLVDLRGLPFDHSAWTQLVSQLTLDEQIRLSAYANHGTIAIESIAKPYEVVEDCPMGVRKPYLTNLNRTTMSFPSNVLLAATFNDRLAYDVGKLLGEDMLHSGATGMYGPSANLHRTPYGGRGFEYYSEDGFLSGIMAKWQVIGMQEKGVYCNMKHFALNDQESNRYGVSIWANEQSIREIYLPAFEYAVTEGDLTGLMSSFTRVGPYWSGAHKGLMTNVLRGEWGFEGFVVSDAAWRDYMGPVDGVMGGNDCILGENTKLDSYEAARTNPTVAKALAESAHRILYVVANSNAMNGFGSNTRVISVMEWWQKLVLAVQIVLGLVTAGLAAVTVLKFVQEKKSGSSANMKESSGRPRKE